MIRKFYIFLLLNCSAFLLPAQVDNLVKLHYVKAANKQISMIGYEMGSHRINFNICGGIGNGIDDQSISPDDLNNGKAKEKIRESQTVYPVPLPPNSYLEHCVSNYKIQQVRIGFTVFVRRNDTLSRHPFTGPHFGVEAMYTNTSETQTVTYKSFSNETRNVYSATKHFPEIGAGTHVGWQFCFYKEHIYLDLRAVIPFYFPFTPEPNLNSPFAGNKWEAQVSIGWRFHKDEKNEKVKDQDKDQVRQKI